ncbi:MAG: hypothetical protein PHH60_04060, partial [Candidatus Margulisbacteria bacterium]|nr:hypothetical protein [Candidatus Margulisiibacteriota bacterium]
MVNQAIAPIIPNIGNLEAAVAGSQAVTFTATDRKIIEERGGQVDKSRSFFDLLKEKPLTPEVENEETNVKPQQDAKELKRRYHEHKSMLKHAALYNPREHVEITNALPDHYEEPRQIILAPEEQPASAQNAVSQEQREKLKQVVEATAKIAKELKLNPAELFDKFALEQSELHSLISRVKEYHLKRLLTENESEFTSLTEAIKNETIHS